MRRSLSSSILIALASLVPATGFAQGMPSGTTPMAVDIKKVPIGTWAEYSMKVGDPGPEAMSMKSRWSMIGRDAKSNTLEMLVEGGMMVAVGGKMILKMVLAPDPVGLEKPIQQLIMQGKDMDPMEMPLDMPGVPPQKFKKPDPKNLIGKEQLKVAAGNFKTSHYREVDDKGTVDMWLNEDVGPLGIVKMTTKPKPGATGGPRGQPIPPVVMELTARGKDAKAMVTKPAGPFDPSVFSRAGRPAPGGPHGGSPHGGPPPATGAEPGKTPPPRK